MKSPAHCNDCVYQLFSEQLTCLDSDEGLMTAAVAVSQHVQPNNSLAEVNTRLDNLADQVRLRVRSNNELALLTHLHEVLFVEEGFRGSRDGYYEATNSFLPAVLRQRRGIPITLCLVYKLVAGRLGLKVEGVNAPGHFLIRVYTKQDVMLVDPFNGGRLLSDSDACNLIEQITGYSAVGDDRCFQAATNKQWLARLLANLLHVYSMQGCAAEVAAMSELYDLLKNVRLR